MSPHRLPPLRSLQQPPGSQEVSAANAKPGSPAPTPPGGVCPGCGHVRGRAWHFPPSTHQSGDPPAAFPGLATSRCVSCSPTCSQPFSLSSRSLGQDEVKFSIEVLTRRKTSLATCPLQSHADPTPQPVLLTRPSLPPACPSGEQSWGDAARTASLFLSALQLLLTPCGQVPRAHWLPALAPPGQCGRGQRG